MNRLPHQLHLKAMLTPKSLIHKERGMRPGFSCLHVGHREIVLLNEVIRDLGMGQDMKICIIKETPVKSTGGPSRSSSFRVKIDGLATMG